MSGPTDWILRYIKTTFTFLTPNNADLFLDWLNFQKKRKITQTEKRQRDCVYDCSKHNRGYIKEWEKEYACFAYDDENNAMFCSSTLSQVRVVGVGKIPPARLESGEIMRSRRIKAGLVKSLAD